jgi:hypothetical protein
MKKAWFASLSALPLPVFGHEGHGFSSAMNVLHYIVEPEHVAPLLIVAILAGGWRWFRARAPKATETLPRSGRGRAN